jgi:hypothetical protein
MGLAVIGEINKGNLLMLGKRDSATSVPLFSIDGVHPLPETGHRLYTQVLSKNLPLLDNKLSGRKHLLPAPLEVNNWEDAGMYDLSKKIKFNGDWQYTDSVTKGKEYYPLLPRVQSTSSADASLIVSFKGSRFGMADIMGPGTSAVEITIDDQPPRVINRFDAFSTYYRMNYFILSGLGKGKHTAIVKPATLPIDKAAILKTRNTVVKDWSAYEKNVLYVGAILY